MRAAEELEYLLDAELGRVVNRGERQAAETTHSHRRKVSLDNLCDATKKAIAEE